MSGSFRPCALIPTYDNPLTIRSVVEGVGRHLSDIVVVDDGSGEGAQQVLREIADRGLAHVIHRPSNGGKGAAVKTGFAEARRLGFRHAVQIDADGQHDLDDLPRFLELAQRNPDALILGQPVFDASLPRARGLARHISRFWVDLEAGRGIIADPQCGFRIYPIDAAMAAGAAGDHMEFDQELPVRMVWGGARVINVPTRVRYLPPEEGGVSHFDLVRDNLRISWLHTRLAISAAARRLGRG